MKKKEYEQKLIQKLAKRNENYYKGIMKETIRKKFFSLSARAFEVNKILEEDMGITIFNRGDGVEIYKKEGHLRHIRNFKKRK